MTDEELKALEEKWMQRLRTGVYSDRSWLAECVSDLVHVIAEWRKQISERQIEADKYSAQSMGVIRAQLKQSLFADLTNEQRYELHCHFYLDTPMTHLANTQYVVKDRFNRWVANLKAREDWEQLKWAGLTISKEGKITEDRTLAAWGKKE